jgi:hypothetical protein
MQPIPKTQQFQVAQVIVSYMIQSHEIPLLSSTATTIDVAEQKKHKKNNEFLFFFTDGLTQRIVLGIQTWE